jgi:hypothetical protein
MRPKVITASMLQEMRSLRLSGMAFRDIADKFGVSTMTAYYNISGKRFVRLTPPSQLVAANDNHPDRITKMMPHNGGCSTTSGLMPVSLARSATQPTEKVAA